MKNILFILFAFLLISCEKEELPLLKPVTEGEVTIASVDMTENYSYQIWFDLGSNTAVKRNLKTDWDISFDGGDSNSYIYLNGSLAAKAAISNTSDFNSLNSASNLTFNSDHQSGSKDSLAIGDWQNHQKVIVIDRGYTPKGKLLGMIKIQFTKLENNLYTFKYSKLDGSDYNEATVSKNNLYNRIYYSFTENNIADIEPFKTDYDICFTQYTYIFYNPYNPYLVTGVLINPYKTSVAEERNISFENIEISKALEYSYSNEQDAIGYEWKYFDLANNVFTIFPNYIFLINDSEDYTYKLHFLDFFDDNGIKGTPTFEYKRL